MDLLHFISSHPLELVTVVVSLIWLYLEYRASIWLWPVGILLPLLWIPICWQSRLYGMLAINIYYLVTSIIGWVVWLQKRGDEAEEKPITDISLRTALVYSLGAIVGYLGLLQLKPFVPEWQVPWADALTTIASVIGMIWMARKWRQHWLCWILANAAGFVALYGAEDYISSFVYVVNFITAFFGYRKWGRLMHSHDEAPAQTTQH
ncbi:nicotinamide riboside transporter PnuC [uncultured Porphyromonas sp.]|uniref:nicotinamide riboside transporter PnuC n=1 Tax=uncultured Porphyromonas sp. TaxID=159274 RepID=UPI002633E552|nr:nicotinamide riboside transporter PnuC [uncultured Porphyromonas sp.]